MVTGKCPLGEKHTEQDNTKPGKQGRIVVGLRFALHEANPVEVAWRKSLQTDQITRNNNGDAGNQVKPVKAQEQQAKHTGNSNKMQNAKVDELSIRYEQLEEWAITNGRNWSTVQDWYCAMKKEGMV